ncbi:MULTISPECIES: HigA family addiction module antitoxin [unclassified Janthinobacterium]|uniref:HigA family addiction module antitoxin n=1 Tax=unclassified Janthinobacterium TaxID=2610881 RepID=UPI00047757DF|nr:MULTISPECIES: HigA family addiction module antitoxin [unclassified Janthinobacterium]MEC5159872.1 HTH-type transcriptional regulator/antitoxin HigA [Janthinobacterium sp. CG_S6]
MGARIPAEIFPPGEFLKDELEARGWTQVEFAEIIGKDTRLISEVISGKRSVTPETAMALGEALDTGAEFWMNLESQYQLSKVRPTQTSIARKAALHGKFPVHEMIKRGWIEANKNIEILEKQVFDFFGVAANDEIPSFMHAAKKTSYSDASMLQIAWLCRARSAAMSSPAEKYSESKWSVVWAELREQLEFIDGVRNVASILQKAGIKFVIIEPLPGCKIDGACFWLNKDTPVIALSLRFDRVDNFWHSLFHELDHVKHKEGMSQPVIDIDIFSTELGGMPPIEVRANEAASQFLVPKKDLEGFIARVNPSFSDDQIVGFSRRMRVHPGIVVGQLQNRKLIPYSFHRKYLEKVRALVTRSAVTDGFRQMLND